MKKLALIISLLTIMTLFVYLFLTTPSAEWGTYGRSSEDEPSDIIPANDGGYIIAGKTFETDSAITSDIYFLKIDTDGNMEWSKTYGHPQKVDKVTKLFSLTNTYIASGDMHNKNKSGDFFLMKLNESGDSLWTKYYGGKGYEILKNSITTADKGYLLMGRTSSFGAGKFNDAYIVRVDSLGNTRWTKQIGGEDYHLEVPFSAVQVSDGGFIISMTKREVGIGDADIFLIKLDDSGDSLWAKRYGGPYNDYGPEIIKTSDDNYLLSGGYGNSPHPTDAVWFLIKFNDSGDTLWTKKFNDWPRSRGEDIKLLPDGGFIAINSAMPTDTANFNIWVTRLDSEGDILWNSFFGGNEKDVGEAVIPSSDGGFVITGSVSSFGAGNYDYFVAKLDSLGNSSIEEKMIPDMTPKRE